MSPCRLSPRQHTGSVAARRPKSRCIARLRAAVFDRVRRARTRPTHLLILPRRVRCQPAGRGRAHCTSIPGGRWHGDAWRFWGFWVAQMDRGGGAFRPGGRHDALRIASSRAGIRGTWPVAGLASPLPESERPVPRAHPVPGRVREAYRCRHPPRRLAAPHQPTDGGEHERQHTRQRPGGRHRAVPDPPW
jgi:hypothetical protein